MKKVLLLLLLLTIARGRVAAQDQDNDDVQFWPDVTLGFKLNPRVTWSLVGTLRAGRDLHALVSEQIGTSFSFKVTNYLNLAPGYRHIWSQSNPAKHTQESRYSVDVTPRLPLPKGFTLSDRNRGEVREINDQISWRYRNRMQLEKTLTWHERQLTPYVAGEIHYDSRYHEWNRKQFWAGTRIPVSKHFTLDLHYSRNQDARAHPGYWHVIGLFSRFEF